MIETINSQNFKSKVESSKSPVLLDFWAPWCGHCIALNPVLDEFAEQEKELFIGKINIDDEPDLAKKFKIRTIPTVMLLKDGEIQGRKIAPKAIEELDDLLLS